MKSSKKILGASAALGLAVALSAGSTFAWFAAGNPQVSVEGMQFGVVTNADGIDLKVAIVSTNTQAGQPTEFDYTADFTAVQALEVYQDVKLKALTLGKADADPFGTTKDVNLYDAAGKKAADAAKVEDKGFVEFRLVFRSTKAGYLYLENTSSVTPQENANTTLTLADSEIGAELSNKIAGNNYTAASAAGTDYVINGSGDARTVDINARAANAARVMFNPNVSGTDPYVWCPNEFYYSGKTCTSDATEESGRQAGFYKNNLAGDFNHIWSQAATVGANATFGTGSGYVAKQQKEYTRHIVPLTATNEASATQIAEFKTPAEVSANFDKVNVEGTDQDYITGEGFAAVIDVTVWIEGTDGDCFDAIFSDIFEVALNFKAIEKKTA